MLSVVCLISRGNVFLFLKCSYVICLDSCCFSCDQLWLKSSLREVVISYLKVQLSKEGIHSGGSSMVCDFFYVVRELLDRIETAKDNKKLDDLQIEIPKEHDNLHVNVLRKYTTLNLQRLDYLKKMEQYVMERGNSE